MTDIADATDLMETARDALLRELVPALPAERRYLALMIANAMAIAAREQRLGTAVVSDEAAHLADLLAEIGRLPFRSAPVAATKDRRTLRKAVAAAIREGRFDEPGRAAALVTRLAHTSRECVAISNPKALGPEALAPAPSAGCAQKDA